MSKVEFNVLSEDKAKNSLESFNEITNTILLYRNGMWGESVFGNFLLLGGGYSNTYFSTAEKNIASEDYSMNTDRRYSRFVLLSMTSRPGMWGEAMFGNSDLLGAGTLNYFEG